MSVTVVVAVDSSSSYEPGTDFITSETFRDVEQRALHTAPRSTPSDPRIICLPMLLILVPPSILTADPNNKFS
jgi:hypothetical protein